MSSVLADSCHPESVMLFPCLSYCCDVSEVKTNGIFGIALYRCLVKIAALIFIVYLTELVAILPVRNNAKYLDSVHAFRSSQPKLTNCRTVHRLETPESCCL